MTLLDRTRESFGPPRRTLEGFLQPKPPAWMARDELRAFYDRFRPTLETGDLIWGHVVQANTILFRPGDEVSGAVVAYGTAPDRDVTPTELRRAASAAMAAKGKKQVDPALAFVGATLAAEYTRHPAIDLPPPVTRGVAMRMAIAVVHREFLPRGYLVSGLLPLVASPERDFVCLLPARYWAEDLVRGWLSLDLILA